MFRLPLQELLDNWVQSLKSDYLKLNPFQAHSSGDRPIIPVHLSILTQFFPPDYAPTGQLIEELSKQLAQNGVQVEVFTGQPGYAFQADSAPNLEWRHQVRIRRSRSAQFWPQRIRGKAVNGVLFCIRAAIHLLKAWRYHNVVLLTTAPPFLPVIGYLAHTLLRLPYACLLYDLYPDIAVNLRVLSPRHWLVRFWRQVNRLVWRQAEAIIVLSEGMKQQILRHCPEVADKITVIHSWADPQAIHPLPKADNWFARTHQLVDRFTVLYSGNMGRCHDLETILDCMVLLQAEPIQFVFVGGGPQRAAFQEKVDRLNLHHCLFLPYQPKETLPYSLTACDLALVSVSPQMENLIAPSKLYSALAAGRPIAAICPPSSYLHSLIAEAGCGTTVTNRDAHQLAAFIRTLSTHPEQVEAMGQSGRHYLEQNFTPSIIAHQYFRVLSQILIPKEIRHLAIAAPLVAAAPPDPLRHRTPR